MSKLSIMTSDTSSYPHSYSSDVIFSFNDTVDETFHSSSSEDFHTLAKNFFFPKKTSTGLLPPGLLYHNSYMIIFEQPPTQKIISYYPHMLSEIPENAQPKMVTLPIPWQVYIIIYNIDPYTSKAYPVDVYMFFRNSQLFSQDDFLYLPPLSNFYANGKLCRPFFDSFDDIDRYDNSITGVIQAAYDWVWNSNTNVDLTACVAEYFIQYQNNFDQDQRLIFDYFFDGRNSVRHAVSSSAYYVNANIVKDFYRAWSKIPLDQILEFSWSNPCYHEIYHHHQRSVIDDLFSNISHYQFLAFLNDNDVDTDEYSEEELDNISFSDFDFSDETILNYFNISPRDEVRSLKDVVSNINIHSDFLAPKSFRKDMLNIYNFFSNQS